MRLRSLLPALAALVTATSTAGAQTSFTESYSFMSGPAVAPGYLSFTVSTPGTFAIQTSMNSDPMIWLFAGTPAALGAALDFNDDWADLNSFLQLGLGAGQYTVAVGRYSFSEQEARMGSMNSTAMSGTLSVTSNDGVAADFHSQMGTTTAPEPGTWALMGSGLLGLAGVARRRRATA